MTLTGIVVTTIVIAMGIYDLFAVVFIGEKASISRFFQFQSMRHPFIPFTVGYICGHIFGYMSP